MAVDEGKNDRVNTGPFFNLMTEDVASNSVPNHKIIIIRPENGYQALCCPVSTAYLGIDYRVGRSEFL
jgi:hypothetical protein